MFHDKIPILADENIIKSIFDDDYIYFQSEVPIYSEGYLKSEGSSLYQFWIARKSGEYNVQETSETFNLNREGECTKEDYNQKF